MNGVFLLNITIQTWWMDIKSTRSVILDKISNSAFGHLVINGKPMCTKGFDGEEEEEEVEEGEGFDDVEARTICRYRAFEMRSPVSNFSL